ncbi:MAG: hypothetical protein Q9216_003560 [Gyalolechia sp. 2 TL-2023]
MQGVENDVLAPPAGKSVHLQNAINALEVNIQAFESTHIYSNDTSITSGILHRPADVAALFDKSCHAIKNQTEACGKTAAVHRSLASENARLRQERNEERCLRKSALKKLGEAKDAKSVLEGQLKDAAETDETSSLRHSLLEEQIAAVTAERESFKGNTSGLETSCTRLRGQWSEYKKEKTALQVRNGSFANQREQLRREVSALQKEQTEGKKQRDILEASNKSFAQLKNQCEELEQLASMATDQDRISQQRIRSTTAELEAANANLQEKDFSLFEHALRASQLDPEVSRTRKKVTSVVQEKARLSASNNTLQDILRNGLSRKNGLIKAPKAELVIGNTKLIRG